MFFVVLGIFAVILGLLFRVGPKQGARMKAAGMTFYALAVLLIAFGIFV